MLSFRGSLIEINPDLACETPFWLLKHYFAWLNSHYLLVKSIVCWLNHHFLQVKSPFWLVKFTYSLFEPQKNRCFLPCSPCVPATPLHHGTRTGMDGCDDVEGCDLLGPCNLRSRLKMGKYHGIYIYIRDNYGINISWNYHGIMTTI